eukprot:TRINITY_DN52314_c0_g1_i1.p1 TRINITY_DN52314_c0_g1~~TRINITY_DN52314_c0_g1_i1.p1  ORF type:complete len:359 (-),score=57.42 TRINITY_DN52314_c0_g1_i1:30-1106(-)
MAPLFTIVLFLVLAFVGQASKTHPQRRPHKYGFYMHVYNEDAAIIYQVRQLKKFFPDSPIYIMSDGGADYSALCKELGCTSDICPPANDRWHPWPFFRRMYDAAVSLNSEYVVMLEPDNTIEGPIRHEPEFDAGGLSLDGRKYGRNGVLEYITSLAQEHVKNFNWDNSSWNVGLCGGSYYRTDALLDAISDDNMMQIDWAKVARLEDKEIYSSDFALAHAFAARGYTVGPWAETAQMAKKKDKPVAGTLQSAFRHYCSCYPGGKPTHHLKFAEEDRHLQGKPVMEYKNNKWDRNCQLCYDSDEYKQAWGSLKCTNPHHVHQEWRSSFLQVRRTEHMLSGEEAHQRDVAARDARLGCPQ